MPYSGNGQKNNSALSRHNTRDPLVQFKRSYSARVMRPGKMPPKPTERKMQQPPYPALPSDVVSTLPEGRPLRGKPGDAPYPRSPNDLHPRK